MEKNIKKFRALRQEAIDQLHQLHNIAQTAIDNVASRRLFKLRCEDISTINDEFKENHSNLISLLSGVDGADMVVEQNIRESFNQDYYAIKAIYEDIFENNKPNNIVSNISNYNLPKLDLLHFKGDLREFTTFKDMFESSVHNNKNLSNIEKFNYLISCLSGPPLILAKTLPLTDTNYLIIYQKLIARYTNKRILANSHWREIETFRKLSSHDTISLQRLLDVFSENLNALKTIGLPVDQWDFILVNKMLEKLDNETAAAYELSLTNNEIPTFASLLKFVEHHCQALENIAFINSPEKSKRLEKSSRYNSSVFFSNYSESVVACFLCGKSHQLYKCADFAKRSVEDRYNFAKNKKLCTNCLSSLHTSRFCKSKSLCKICNKRHHSLLHFENKNTVITSTIQNGSIQGGSLNNYGQNNTEQNASIQGAVQNSRLTETYIQGDGIQTGPSTSSGTTLQITASPVRIQPSATAQSFTGIISRNTGVLLSTALVEIADKWGNFHICRALLDSGSQTTFMSQKCYNKLNLTRTKLSLSVRGLGSMQTVLDSGAVNTTCRPVGKPTPLLDIFAVVLPKVCETIPSTELQNHSWPHISNLTLADPTFYIPGDIDILLGADMYPQILLDGYIRGNLEQPVAQNTIFGYVLMGKVKMHVLPQVNSLFCSSDYEPLEHILKQFWELENTFNLPVISKEDKLCEEIYRNTTTRDVDGRYIVHLPFREMEPHFQNSRSIALQFLYGLERRLIKNPALYNQYASFMKEYLEQGHMEAAPVPDISEQNFYLPHSCVLKPESTSTKLRVVFNASVKMRSGPTLNDTLYIGPKLQTDIIGILLKFRLHKFVFTADIKQMYRQIWITDSHRNYQRILWRFSPEEPVQDYRLNTVTYGISSAPYLAIRTLLKLADDEGTEFPNAASVLRSDIYVDDIVTGSSSFENAKLLQSEIITMLARGGFQLRKWASNEPNLLTELPTSYLANDSHFWDEGSGLKILGLYWRPSSDDFSYRVTLVDGPCTKRQILSELARIFDPIGFLTPITFFIKRVLQRLWFVGLSWDDPPPKDIVQFWSRFREELPLLSKTQIPRCIIHNPEAKFQLHGFCDASLHGYASVIYLRESYAGKNYVHFVCSKARVAPLRRISIPRLELCAAVMLSDLITLVLKTYQGKVDFDGIYAWSDSTITLSWIHSSAHRWQTFVSNRISYIQEKLAPSHWRHVQSSENPADIASRGLFPTEFLDNNQWWTGPSFLKAPVSWPDTFNVEQFSPEALNESRKISLHAVTEEHFLDMLLNRFSLFSKLQRILAYILRFISNCKNAASKILSHLTQIELNNALFLLVKHTQFSTFSTEINCLNKHLKLSKPFRKLGVFSDNSGLLRVGGRLKHSSLSYDRKYPLLLPRSCRLTTLLIEWYHLKYLHAGCQTVQFLLAQNFWILSSRRVVRTIISQCHTCWRQNPKPYQPIMGDLPKFRVSELKAFSHVGVDYGGPFMITLSRIRGAKTLKAYLCLFVCMSTKALHLELASDLTSEAFLAALRRFIARRGRPNHIYSDCGTNFISSQKQLAKLMQTAAATESLQWHFNPPHAPHFGGLWEAGIKSVKSHLKRIIGQQLLTYEEFYTILVQIEAILNSRPLTPLSNDPHDLLALTPAHFLNLEPLSCLPEQQVQDVPLGRLSRWQLLQRIHQDFWSRWRKEYLHTLSQKSKWTSSDPKSITPGDLVMLKNELTPPLEWSLGRVVEVFAGADGVVRVATVRTKNCILKRPLVKLCPLPISVNSI